VNLLYLLKIPCSIPVVKIGFSGFLFGFPVRWARSMSRFSRPVVLLDCPLVLVRMFSLSGFNCPNVPVQKSGCPARLSCPIAPLVVLIVLTFVGPECPDRLFCPVVLTACPLVGVSFRPAQGCFPRNTWPLVRRIVLLFCPVWVVRNSTISRAIFFIRSSIVRISNPTQVSYPQKSSRLTCGSPAEGLARRLRFSATAVTGLESGGIVLVDISNCTATDLFGVRLSSFGALTVRTFVGPECPVLAVLVGLPYLRLCFPPYYNWGGK